MTQPSPVFAPRPQFTPEHWAKVPREVHQCAIKRLTNISSPDNGEPWVEVILTNGGRFRRKKSEIKQLLTVNLEVNVEVIRSREGEMVTGMFVPDVGWAFRMTNDDLAEYTKQLSLAVHEQRRRAREGMIEYLAVHLLEGLKELGFEMEVPSGDDGEVVAQELNMDVGRFLAQIAVRAFESGSQ